MPDRVQRQIHDLVRARFSEQAAFLAQLVRCPSDNPPGDCAGFAERTAALLEGLGLAVERYPVPAPEARANGMVSATNLVVRHRFGAGPTIALNAHGDAVPPGAGWSRDPYGAAIVDGAMYGRGVAVSKSDIATYAFALLALIDGGTPLGGTVELHVTSDEEAGGAIGPKWLIERGISRPDYAIAPGFSYGVVTAHNGCLHLEIDIAGQQAHAALPAAGVDALEAAAGVLSALYRHRQGYATRHSTVEGIDTPAAAFVRDGMFVGANAAAQSLPGLRNLSEAGLDDARSEALTQGRAETPAGFGQMVLQRVGSGADVGLVALITPDATLVHSQPAVPAKALRSD